MSFIKPMLQSKLNINSRFTQHMIYENSHLQKGDFFYAVHSKEGFFLYRD
jgi:hypothetical protein